MEYFKILSNYCSQRALLRTFVYEKELSDNFIGKLYKIYFESSKYQTYLSWGVTEDFWKV